jgi:alkylation response protein AidB-like acyl-CoA dehydrogenase
VSAGIDLGFDAAARAIGDALTAFCKDRCPDEVARRAAGQFPHELWKELASLGVLAIATPEGDGGAVELVAAHEALGRFAFPGPLVATHLAAQLVPERERRSLAAGEVLVCVAEDELLPWAPLAGVFVALQGERAWLARPQIEGDALETLGGEPFARGALVRETELAGVPRALALAEIALAAQLAALGQELIERACAHARTRRQFGQPIGDFQAVSHPLADCAIRLSASTTLARMAAFAWDHAEPDAHAAASAARLSAGEAALAAAMTAHQVFGAIGVTLEGPVFHLSRRVRQLGAHAPGLAGARERVLCARGNG